MRSGKLFPAFALSLLLCVPAAPVRAGSAGSEWDQILAAARMEGRVVVSAPRGNDALQRVITEAFPAKYGIQVDYRGLGAAEMLRRLPTEREAGDFEWDVIIGGTDSLLLNVKALGYLDPIVPALQPEVADPGNWEGGQLPFWDNNGIGIAMLREAGQYFFVNTTLADPASITSYQALLDPGWRGNILLTSDPRTGGHGRSVFTFFHEHPQLGPDFVRKLWLEQDLRIPHDDDEADELVRSGQYAMCICNRAQGALLARQRLPYQVLDPHQIAEGIDVTSSFANVALVNQAPHPNARRVFVNWLLSAEAVQLISEATGVPSTRADVSKDMLEPGTTPDPSWPVANTEQNVPNGARLVAFLQSLGEPA